MGNLHHFARGAAVVAIGVASLRAQAAPVWNGYAGDAQHTAVSSVASQPLETIRWQTPVDLAPQYSGTNLLIHYGSPMVTAANTIIVPVKTGATNGFMLNAVNGATGTTIWTATTDYVLPNHGWTPSYSPTLTPGNRVYYAGIGGTVYYRDGADAAVPSGSGQIAFFGNANYTANAASTAAYNSNVFISTPITSDAAGNIYFGFRTQGATPLGLTSGIARIDSSGSGTYVSAAAVGGAGMNTAVMNCAPAISADGSTLYIAVSNGPGGLTPIGKLLSLNSTTLALEHSVMVKDAKSGSNAWLADNGTASPTVGPDGDVYFGVVENPFPANHDRGWLLHYSPDLATLKTPGAFGWDDTASIVPATMVPSYGGASSYLVMTKYNNYAGAGGNGLNKIAILDPNDTMVDPITGATVMKEVLTIAGPTADASFPSFPLAVREWCINTAVVDPATKSVLVNNEDGKLYRWDLTTNTLSQVVTLTAGLGEAYTPTIIAADGSVLAINNAILFNVGAVPEPGSAAILGIATLALARRRQGRTRRSALAPPC